MRSQADCAEIILDPCPSDTAPAPKLSTGEYRQLLRQQYERMAQHQQVIEAEQRAQNNR